MEKWLNGKAIREIFKLGQSDINTITFLFITKIKITLYDALSLPVMNSIIIEELVRMEKSL